MAVTTLKTWHYKAGYDVRYEEYSGEDAHGGPTMVMRSAYTPDGDYIGNPQDARFLVVEKGIAPELRTDTNNVCSVGFCEAEQKWYGWSHRAIAGFAIGDKIFEEDWSEATDDTPFLQHGPDVITNPEEARRAAANFAASVS